MRDFLAVIGCRHTEATQFDDPLRLQAQAFARGRQHAYLRHFVEDARNQIGNLEQVFQVIEH
jgi:hypothetical protein